MILRHRAVLALCLLVLAGCTVRVEPVADHPVEGLSGAAQPVTAQPVTAELGPTGVAGLTLGMTREAAMATELLTQVKVADTGCSGHDLVAFPTAPDNVSVYVSDTVGLAAIFASEGMRTPEGIGLGSTAEEVKAAYPGLGEGPNSSAIPVPGNAKAFYEISIDSGRVAELVLAVIGQDCFG